MNVINTMKVTFSIVVCSCLVACDKYPILETRTDEYYNGQIKSEWGVTMDSVGNYVKHGPFQEWHSNGEKRSQGSFYLGTGDGNYKSWFDNGKIENDFNFTRGTYHGNYISYYDNEQIKLQGKYVDGNPIDKWVEWSRYGEKTADLDISISQDGWNGAFNDYLPWGGLLGIDSTKYEFDDAEGSSEYTSYFSNGSLLKNFIRFKGNKIEKLYHSKVIPLTPIERFKEAFFWLPSDKSIYWDSTITYDSFNRIESIKVNDVVILGK